MNDEIKEIINTEVEEKKINKVISNVVKIEKIDIDKLKKIDIKIGSAQREVKDIKKDMEIFTLKLQLSNITLKEKNNFLKITDNDLTIFMETLKEKYNIDPKNGTFNVDTCLFTKKDIN